jgi:hypothetical protein
VTTDRNCLDAETVAAWMDGGLDAAGVAAAEAHASTCQRCQELLATVAKTLPAEREQSAVVSGFSRIDKYQSLWRWWLAPIAATAAAVTIWMVVPQTPMQPPAASAPAREAAAEAPAAGPAESALAKPAAPTPAPSAATPRDSLADARRNVPAAANQAKATVATGADTPKFDEALGSASARDQSAERQRDAQGKREEGKALAEMRQAAESASAREQSAELRRDRPAAAPPAAAGLGAVNQLRKESGPLQIVSPDSNSRWRATPAGIERSEDGGRIWIPVRLAGKEEVLAGASPGRLVAWLVGRSGLVLLTTDGANFTRLPFPESVDLVAVSSPEPRIATVTTADGRVYRTENAGRSWSLQDFEAFPF